MSVPPCMRNAALSAAREKLYSLQILRFLAAFLVFFSHIEDRYRKLGTEISPDRFHASGLDGQLGVDIFFVISGFVMGFVTLDRFGKSGAARKFAAARGEQDHSAVLGSHLSVQCGVISGRARNLAAISIWHGSTWRNWLKSLLFVPYFNVDRQTPACAGTGMDAELRNGVLPHGRCKLIPAQGLGHRGHYRKFCADLVDWGEFCSPRTPPCASGPCPSFSNSCWASISRLGRRTLGWQLRRKRFRAFRP